MSDIEWDGWTCPVRILKDWLMATGTWCASFGIRNVWQAIKRSSSSFSKNEITRSSTGSFDTKLMFAVATCRYS